MTGLLNDVMHERADRAGTPDLDLDAIMTAGDRRVRGRRLTTGLAVVGVAGVVAVAGVALPGLLDHDGAPAPTTSPFAARDVSWAVGSTIHWGSQTFDVGQRVRSYVQTDDGFVWTSPDETVHLFDGSSSRRIGRADGGYLATDDTGSLVAWTTPGTAKRDPAYVGYDTAARAVVDEVDAGSPADDGEVGQVMALDGSALYWRRGDDIVRHDLDGGDTVLWSQAAPADPATKSEPAIWQVADVADGAIAYFVERGDAWGLAVGRGIEPDAPVLSTASNGYLSPDGRYLASEQDDFIAVHDTTTGGEVGPDLSRYPYAVGYAWVDDDTVMAYGLKDIDGDGPYAADMLSCDIGADCTVVASLDVGIDDFALPIGRPLD